MGNYHNTANFLCKYTGTCYNADGPQWEGVLLILGALPHYRRSHKLSCVTVVACYSVLHTNL